MAQAIFSAGASLSDIDSRAREAQSLARLIRDRAGGRAILARVDGGSVATDRVRVAASAAFAVQVKGLSTVAAIASEASSLLQAADAGLARIEDKLDDIIALAKSLTTEYLKHEISNFEGAQLDAQFKALKAAADEIANDTGFEGTKLLAGGAGPSGEFQAGFHVGTGVASEDDITVLIAKPDIAGLSSGLNTGNLRSQAAATTAYADAEEAKRVLRKIRGGISGDIERFGAVQTNAAAFGARAESARAGLADPTVAIDFSRLTADRITDAAGLHLVKGAVAQFQNLINRINRAEQPTRSDRIGKPASESGLQRTAPAKAAVTQRTASSGASESTDS